MARTVSNPDKLYNGLTRDEVIRTHKPSVAAEILGLGRTTISEARKKLGLEMRPHRASDGKPYFRFRASKYYLRYLRCPRCGKDTKNKAEGQSMFCVNIAPDGSKCMYHYSNRDVEALRLKIDNRKSRKGGKGGKGSKES